MWLGVTTFAFLDGKLKVFNTDRLWNYFKIINFQSLLSTNFSFPSNFLARKVKSQKCTAVIVTIRHKKYNIFWDFASDTKNANIKWLQTPNVLYINRDIAHTDFCITRLYKSHFNPSFHLNLNHFPQIRLPFLE